MSARFRLPENIFTDNSTCFVSSEFESFHESNGIKHVPLAPYHSASNRLAILIVKKGLKKVVIGNIKDRLAKVLMAYHHTPTSTTGIHLAEFLLGRCPQSRLDLLQPHTVNLLRTNSRNR